MISDLADVRRALENDEMVASFQPLIGLQSGALTGFELLARWQRPGFEPVLPLNFIPLAEENGLIAELTRQVLRKAFDAAPLLGEPLVLSVNISPVQLTDHGLAKSIRDLAEAGGFPLDRLIVEITEGAMLTDLERARSLAYELTGMGCRLALDDFGTGYSSLAQLQALPFSELKVDRSFVDAMMKSRESRKIVASIIGLGHSLGLITVAEGIETEAQADMLLWLGCEQGQGWLYGKAMAMDRISSVIDTPPRPTSPSMRSPGEGWASSSLEALPAQRLSQLQAIYDGAPVGLCFLDRNLRYISLNQRLADINEIPLAAHIGKTVAEVLPDVFPRIEHYLRCVLEGEAIPETDISVPSRTGDGSAKQLRVTFYPALDEADEVIGISVAILDIASDGSSPEPPSNPGDTGYIPLPTSDFGRPGATTVWGREGGGAGTIPQPSGLQSSAQWVRTLETVRARVRNLGWMEAIHPDDLEPTISTIRAALQADKPVDLEYRVGDLDDQWKWMRSAGRPRIGPSGEVVRWYGTVEEIHDLKMKADQAMSVKPVDETNI
jgi:EAL domain-containing protein (putative c-di-GMP-specific phosphodiesterase class I)